MDTMIEFGARTVVSAVLALVATLMIAGSISQAARASISGENVSGQLIAQQHDATHLVV